MGNLNMEATQIHYRRDSTMTVDKKLQNLEGRVATLEDGEPAEVSKADIAPVFSAETGYSAGDFVYHEGHLYKFTVDHAAGAWSDLDTEPAVVTSDLAELQSDLTAKQDATDNSLQTTDKTIVGGINELKSGLTNYEKQNNINLEVPNRKNLIDSNAYSNGYFTSEGVFTGNQYYYATDYIKVEPNTDYVVSGFTGGGAYFVYYNASKTVLSTVADTTTTFKTPANTAFVRLSIKRDGMTNPQMELGTTATAYTAYIPSVESRLETVEDDVKLNTQDLTTPSRTKNVLPMTLNGIKLANTTGTWSGNAYTVNDVTFTVQTDNDGNVTGINVNGTASGGAAYLVLDGNFNSTALAGCITTGLPNDADSNIIFRISSQYDFTAIQDLYPNNAVTDNGNNLRLSLRININYTVNNVAVYPMLRLASVSDPTFAPYVPSVESRIEAVESGVDNLANPLGTYNVMGIFQTSQLYNNSYGIAVVTGFDPSIHTVTINSASTLDGAVLALTYNQHSTKKGVVGFFVADATVLGKIVNINITVS